MELTFKQLRKREVINVTNGASLGKINDLKLVFPSGKLIGIYVTGKKENCLTKILKKNGLYIDEGKIIKIGNDVILVNLSNEKPIEQECPPPKNPCPKPPDCESLFGENSLEKNCRIDTSDY